jgi:2-polyprenyl-3-methyl-5-hydroxy-6-metoxy-1,4-benzoquinol methylase
VADDRWWRDLDLVVVATLSPGARVLDVGCGDGGFVDRMEELGFEAAGVDPRAPAHPRLTVGTVEALGDGERFDAVTAVMALHHTDLGAVGAALRRLLRPGGRMLVAELAWEAFDERASEWLRRHRGPAEQDSVTAWRREHQELHTSDAVRTALAAVVGLRVDVPRPYLARMLGRPELEHEDRALIDARELPALGRWLLGEMPG